MKWLFVSGTMAAIAVLVALSVFSLVCDIVSQTHVWQDYFSFAMKTYHWFVGLLWLLLFFVGRAAGIGRRSKIHS